MSFEACLPIILQSEGGFVDNPDDPGGATNLGITIGTLSGWLGRPATVADVQALTPQTVAPIYQANYWDKTACDSWGAGVDLMVFDEAVNQGPGRAILTLQTALGVTADGAVGPATQAAAQMENAADIITKMSAIREAFYRGLPTFAEFGTGWMNRLTRTTALAQQMAQGG
jgi:lysozyme family protein